MAINLSVLAPNTPKDTLNEVAGLINKYAPQFQVNTNKRLSAFVAQAVYESDGFKSFVEYGSKDYFKRYEPGTRSGKNLGNLYPGGGAKFKGRGIFQLTGRWNYGYFSKKIFGDDRLLNHPEILESVEYAVLSAFHFWKFKNLNKWADAMNNDAITKILNGPKMYGRAQRNSIFKKTWEMIKPAASTLTGVAVVLAGIFF